MKARLYSSISSVKSAWPTYRRPRQHALFLVFSIIVFFLSSTGQAEDIFAKLQRQSSINATTVTDGSIFSDLSSGGICGVDDILISPNNDKIVLSRLVNRSYLSQPRIVSFVPNRFHVLDIDTGSYQTVSSNIMKYPFAWSQDGAAVQVRMGDRVFAQFVVGDKSFRGGFPVDAVKVNTFYTNGFMSFDDVHKTMSDILRQKSVEQFIDRNADARLGVFSYPHSAYALLPSAPGEKVRLSSDLFSSPVDKRHALWNFQIHRKGMRFYSSALGVGEGLQRAYETSIIDRKTSELIGSRTPNGIFINTNSRPKSLYYSKDEIVLAADANDGMVVFITRDLLGRQNLYTSNRSGELQRQLICDQTTRFRGAPPVGQPPFVSIEAVETQSLLPKAMRVRKVGIALARRRVPDNQLVILFHGGPLESSFEPGAPLAVRAPPLYCGDLMMVDASGAIGVGIAASTRIAREGARAFEVDLDQVERIARALGYSSAHVVTESFGGFHGIAAAKSRSGFYRSVNMIAPPARIATLEEMLAASGIKGNAASELASAQDLRNFVFGRKLPELNRYARHFFAQRSPNVAVYIGDDDNRIDVKLHLELGKGNDALHVFDADHDSIFRHQGVWPQINRTICGRK